MKQLLRRIAGDERGVQVTEWIALGAVLLTLVTALTTVLTGNRSLRAALGDTLGRYAVLFGQDVAAQGPGIPRGPGEVDAFDGGQGVGLIELRPPMPRPTDARVLVNIREGSYLTIDPAGQIVSRVRPAERIAAAVEAASGLIRLSDPLGRRPVALLNPLDGLATVFDPITGVGRAVDVAELERIGLVLVERQRQADPTGRLTAPALGIPRLLDGR
ncbi:MAG TPA: hypothetical protein VFS21_10845 [Roseiflexaceae bacterium]|nr:hypothetical protein [Roseiflexaceae bacterium]